jgi:hypothetical protein
MTKFYLSICLTIGFLSSSSIFYGQGVADREVLEMGPGYANDIFYSFKNGEVSNVARDTWDIAFFTPRFSAGIIINEGNGVELYTYPNGDSSAWSTVDTVGMSTWTPMYNSPEYWEDGAFNVNALGHPDYGWGVYNQINHSVYGDSLYIIKTASGIKKLFIKVKISVDNIYKFKYADLDGSNEQTIELDVKPYETKRFIYYSLANNQAVDREPEKESWDLMFTKYIEMVPTNDGGFEPYLVTGATNNVGIFSNNFYPVGDGYNDWTAKPLDSLKNSIGYDWKSFDMGTFEWTIKDSNYYFIRNYDGDIYKLRFVSWQGSTTGIFTISPSLVSLSSVDETIFSANKFDVYPNPARSSFTIKSNEILSGGCSIGIRDETGRLVFQEDHSAAKLNSGLRMSDLNLSPGLYFITIMNSGRSETQKLIIK